jgi:hypothetical protein
MGNLIGGTISALTGAVIGPKMANTQENVMNQAKYEGATVFGEQQGFEQMLQKLVADPSSITSTPGYAFNQQQGEQAVARQFGPQVGSGAEGIALQKYGQGYAMQTYNQQIQMLSSLAGLSAPTSPTASLGVASSAGNSAMDAWGKMLAAIGMGSQLAGSGIGGGGGGMTPTFNASPDAGLVQAPDMTSGLTNYG